MNTFRNDGSFMQEFLRMQQQNKLSDGGSSGGTRTEKTSSSGQVLEVSMKLKSVVKRHSLVSQKPSTAFSSSLSSQLKLKQPGTTLPTSVRPSVFQDDDHDADLDPKTQDAILSLVAAVLNVGLAAEDNARRNYKGNPAYWFLYDKNSYAYKHYRQLIAEKVAEESSLDDAEEKQDHVKSTTFPARSSSSLTTNHISLHKPEIKPQPSHAKFESTFRGDSASFSLAAVPPPVGAQSSSDGNRRKRSRWGEKSETVQTLTRPELVVPNILKNFSTVPMLPTAPPAPPPPTLVQLPASIAAAIPPPGIATISSLGAAPNVIPIPTAFVPTTSRSTGVSDTDAGFLAFLTDEMMDSPAFAMRMVGSATLTDDQKKQLRQQIELKNTQAIIEARQKAAKLTTEGIVLGKVKPKYEYDSDEDTEDGTWEHKLRKQEMERTKELAQKATDMNRGRHHLSDFLPPDELAKFLDKYQKGGDDSSAVADNSDYKEHRINENNIGFKMLQKMGWSEGSGLGSSGQGITAPVSKGKAPSDMQGLGMPSSLEVNEDDDEYEVYRKRMMLAYRFRPNPLNNPRRPYY